MLRRTFRNVAVIAGLIERHHPGAEKTRKQVTVNSDLIYDVLRRHQPDHILLRATRADAAGGLTDLSRIAGNAGAGEGAHRAHGAVARVAAGGAGAAGDRPRKRADATTTRRSCWPRPRRSSPRRRARRSRRRRRRSDRPAKCHGVRRGTCRRRSVRDAMTAAPIHLAGERLMLDPAGALFWPATGLLAVSDLHLEKGSSYARRGQLLPPWDTHATLDRLTLLLRRYQPRLVIALGDSFHDAEAPRACPRGELARLRAMTEAHRFIWVQGNHDPTPPNGVGGEWVETFATTTLVFRHQAIDARTPRSPATTIPRPRCRRAAAASAAPASSPIPGASMMPAFGAYTGGLDVRDPAIARLFPRGGRVFLLGKERLFSFTLGTLRAG